MTKNEHIYFDVISRHQRKPKYTTKIFMKIFFAAIFIVMCKVML